MENIEDLIEATKDAESRQRQIDANLAAVNVLIARVKSHRWRLLLNRRLLAESRGLLTANQELSAINLTVIARNAAYLAR